MSNKKIEKRSRVGAFVKRVNMSHCMPTRYELDGMSFDYVSKDALADPAKRKEVTSQARKTLKEGYKACKNTWFFAPLRF